MRKHWLGMLVGCGLMAVGLGWLAVGGSVGNGLVWLLILACPLMHLFMGHGHGQEKGDKAKVHSDPREGEENHHET